MRWLVGGEVHGCLRIEDAALTEKFGFDVGSGEGVCGGCGESHDSEIVGGFGTGVAVGNVLSGGSFVDESDLDVRDDVRGGGGEVQGIVYGAVGA